MGYKLRINGLRTELTTVVLCDTASGVICTAYISIAVNFTGYFVFNVNNGDYCLDIISFLKDSSF